MNTTEASNLLCVAKLRTCMDGCEPSACLYDCMAKSHRATVPEKIPPYQAMDAELHMLKSQGSGARTQNLWDHH